jgi:hypothetical protein
MIEDWSWDKEGYPRGLINPDRSVRIARDVRESTPYKSVYEMRYRGTIYKLDATIAMETATNTIVVSCNYCDMKKSVEAYNRLQKSLHPYEGVIAAFKEALLAYMQEELFSGKVGLKRQQLGFRLELKVLQ